MNNPIALKIMFKAFLTAHSTLRYLKVKNIDNFIKNVNQPNIVHFVEGLNWGIWVSKFKPVVSAIYCKLPVVSYCKMLTHHFFIISQLSVRIFCQLSVKNSGKYQ